MPKPIVVLTPVRNEAWILDRFLKVTSCFADLVIVADQQSTDGSREICSRFPRVAVVANDTPAYDEASRQLLLLEEARRRIPGPKVLLALDADELVAADAMGSPDWSRMLEAPPGTVLCFEKPDLYHGTDRCIRFAEPWPLGYVDDGAEHRPLPVHSLRIPMPEGAPRLGLGGIKILHYALVHPELQAAKMRYYSVIENLLSTQRVYARRRGYSANRDWTRNGTLALTDASWFSGWNECGIDLHEIPPPRQSWHDDEILRLFAQHGERRFWLDDIWHVDWESRRLDARRRQLSGLPTQPIQGPPTTLWPVGRAIDRLYSLWCRLRHGIRA